MSRQRYSRPEASNDTQEVGKEENLTAEDVKQLRTEPELASRLFVLRGPAGSQPGERSAGSEIITKEDRTGGVK